MGRGSERPAVVIDTGVGAAVVGPDPRHPSAMTLTIDGNVHGTYDPADPGRLLLDYQARLAEVAGLVLPDGPARILHLGGGAFAVPRALAARRQPPAGPLQQVVVERSAAIIRLARQQLGLRDGPALVVRKGDARAVLARQPDATADLVIGDVFVGLGTPRHLSTVEFLADVRRVLRPGGSYLLNLVDEPPWSVLGAHAATAATQFEEVLAAGSRGVARLRDPGNVLLLATARLPLPDSEMGHRLAVGPTPSALVPRGRLDALVRAHRPRHDSDG